MRREEIFQYIDGRDDTELVVRGQAESAGQVYYEMGIRTDDPLGVGADLKEMAEDTDWSVTVYAEMGWADGDTGRPIGYDHEAEEERPSHIRLKKNLYNEHMI